ncbi:MAG: ArnT family glycosyltransferase [Anaerolineae bacterium]
MNERLPLSKVIGQYGCWIDLGLCLLVLAGYLYNLDAWRMDDDEGEYLYQFWRMAEGEVPYRDFLTPQLPVFLYTGMLWMKLVGHNLFLLRMLSVILAFSTAGLIFQLGRRIGNNASLALTGAFIYLLHPETYRQSRFLRNEALFLFLGVLG